MPLPQSGGRIIGLGFEVGFSLAVPLIVFFQLGAYLDRSWGISPIMTIIGVILALGISGLWLKKRIWPYFRSNEDFE